MQMTLIIKPLEIPIQAECFFCGKDDRVVKTGNGWDKQSINYLVNGKPCCMLHYPGDFSEKMLEAFEKTFFSLPTFEKVIQHFTNPRELIKMFIEFQPVYYDESKLWWVWNFQLNAWDQKDETDLMNAIAHASTADTINSRLKNEILEALKQVSRENKPKPMGKNWVQFQDKIVDFATGEEHKLGPGYFAVNPLPHSVGFSEDTPTMDKLFTQWVGEGNMILLQEIIAYCMIPDYPIHRIFCFNGSGLNGKGSFMDLLRRLLGLRNCCSTELNLLMNSRFESSKLYKKLACLLGETNFSTMKNTSMLKKLTGGDLIGYEFKGKLQFDEINYAKIIIATNSLPQTFDKTDGFYRRWTIIDFPNRFDEKTDILSSIPPEEYQNMMLKCIRIGKRLLKEREFTNQGTIEDRKRKYEELSNPIMLYIRENYKKELNGWVWFSDFKESLDIFLEDRKHRRMSPQEVSAILKSEGYEIKNKKVKGEETTAKAIFGLLSLPSLLTFPTRFHMENRVENMSKLSQLRQPEDDFCITEEEIEEKSEDEV